MIEKEKILFPYPKIREIQSEMIEEVDNCVRNKKNLIAHAPTGIGKTIAALSPALAYAFSNNKTIFFLTSRHTQHHIVINTLRQIKERYNKEVISCDIIGKQWMCAQGGVDALYSNEFIEFCKSLREEDKCEFYANTKSKSGKATTKASAVLADLKNISPCHTEDLANLCLNEKLCPYEMAALLARDAKVIVADYYYIFNPNIRDSFLQKAGKELGDSILIIDEGHNLPKRCRDLLTDKISGFVLDRAVKEAKKFGFKEAEGFLREIKNILVNLSNAIAEENEERIIRKEEFVEKINKVIDYERLINELEFAADEIRKMQKQSYTGGVASFLSNWRGQEKGFSRILSFKETGNEPIITLSYRCLDPSFVTKDIVNNSHSTIIMSGTLTPTNMYKDILGFENVVEKEYNSPFPKKNRLSLIVPETTTKFTRRSEDEFSRIAAKRAKKYFFFF